MPYSLFKKLNIDEVKLTNISLQLDDRSIIYPKGIVEDVLLKVDKFIFPIDLIVLDMEEDKSIPMILGRGFLKTARAIIDVDGGTMTFRVGDDSVEFHLVNKIRYPPEVENCWMVEKIGKPAVEKLNEHPSYLTIDEYIERMESKEAEKKELSGNKKFLKNLMSVQTLKHESKRNSNKVDERTRIEASKLKESCFSIGVVKIQRAWSLRRKKV